MFGQRERTPLALPYDLRRNEAWRPSLRVPFSLSGSVRRSLCRTIYGMLERSRPVQGVATFAQPNDELQRTSDGTAAGSPLNSVFDGPSGVCVVR